MKLAPASYDLIVIGAGPSGQKAAIQGAKEGCRVLLVERQRKAGGECLYRGTIPSKTLRESSVYLHGLRQRSNGSLDVDVCAGFEVKALMRRLSSVLATYENRLEDQLSRNGIERLQGRAAFVSSNEIEIEEPHRKKSRATAETILIATGSRPRHPGDVPVDHEHILDSDSILSLIYLPESLVVLGAGVIACEFASIFVSLGVQVTLVDKRDRPLAFLDEGLTERFVKSFETMGGRFLPNSDVTSVSWSGDIVRTELGSGEVLVSDKVLCALGRVANVEQLQLEQAGVEVNSRGHVPVDEFCRTNVPGIYAAGDVIGPPALAATSMHQGRRAIRHALGLDLGERTDTVPIGIYAIPELASVGLTEAAAREAHGACLVGHSDFSELARGQISGNTEGWLKLICDPRGEKILGAHIVGEGATELIHLAQMAMIADLDVETFVENIFNFPTLAEAYRVAALAILAQKAALRSGHEQAA